MMHYLCRMKFTAKVYTYNEGIKVKLGSANMKREQEMKFDVPSNQNIAAQFSDELKITLINEAQ